MFGGIIREKNLSLKSSGISSFFYQIKDLLLKGTLKILNK